MESGFCAEHCGGSGDTTPVTGDTMPVVPVAVVMVAAMAIAFAVRKKKQSAD